MPATTRSRSKGKKKKAGVRRYGPPRSPNINLAWEIYVFSETAISVRELAEHPDLYDTETGKPLRGCSYGNLNKVCDKEDWVHQRERHFKRAQDKVADHQSTRLATILSRQLDGYENLEGMAMQTIATIVEARLRKDPNATPFEDIQTALAVIFKTYQGQRGTLDMMDIQPLPTTGEGEIEIAADRVNRVAELSGAELPAGTTDG